jgi:hypothetical protein
MPFGEEMRVMLEYPCRARPGEFAAVMYEWTRRLSVDRSELAERIVYPIEKVRLDAPRTRVMFWLGKVPGWCGEIVAIVAPVGSTLVRWSDPSQWTAVEKLWKFVLAELSRRKWCDPETEASDETAAGNLIGFEKKNTRVHNRYLETAKYYVAVHFDVEKTKRCL